MEIPIRESTNKNTKSDQNYKEITSFDIDLDNYDIDLFLPEIKDTVKQEITTIKLTKLTKFFRLKSVFNKWKKKGD